MPGLVVRPGHGAEQAPGRSTAASGRRSSAPSPHVEEGGSRKYPLRTRPLTRLPRRPGRRYLAAPALPPLPSIGTLLATNTTVKDTTSSKIPSTEMAPRSPLSLRS